MRPDIDPAPAAGGPPAPAWLVRSAAVGGRLLVLALLVWLLAALAGRLTLLLVSVLVGLLVAGVLVPVVQWGEAKGVPHWLAALVPVLLLLAAVLGTAALLGARIGAELPQLRAQLEQVAGDLSRSFGIDVPLVGPSGGGSGGSGSGGGSSSAVVGGLLSSLRIIADILIGFFLALALAFLFLKDGRGMWRWLLGKFGGRVREDVDAAGRAAWGTVGAYVRGLTIVALFDAVGIGVGLLLLGIPLALTLAALQFVASYVPTIGAVVAGAVAVAVAYLHGGLATAGIVAVLAIVVQQLGNDVVEPYVMGRELPLNAAMVLVAVTAGGLLWGIPGALLFVPLAAALVAGSHELWARRGCPPLAGREAAG